MLILRCIRQSLYVIQVSGDSAPENGPAATSASLPCCVGNPGEGGGGGTGEGIKINWIVSFPLTLVSYLSDH